MTLGHRLASAATLALSGSAHAADPVLTQSSGWGSLMQGLFGLLVVLGLLYAFLLVLRRYGPATSGAQGIVKGVGGVMLSPRERLVMVEVKDTWLLLGVASGQVSVVHSMPKPEAAETVAAPVPPPFAGKLAAMLRHPGKG
ncbi:MAG: flagellar biosynthetic protein FliO [Hydrogenophilales bacterium]|nr:flagellar biosynthetic protein FliO [Hydrogenophilales bacterium]